jgi:hypothetical protein
LEGTGGPGTYAMSFANAVLNIGVGNLLADQYATSLGVAPSPSEVSSATSDLQSTLDGEINQAVSAASSTGAISYCQNADGSALSGKQLLAALPADVRDAQIRNEAVDEKLLARGADLSDTAVSNFYNANKGLFTQVCVSAIVTDTQAHADSIVTQLNGGASFAGLAKSDSLDTRTASAGGSIGCSFSLSQVKQSLQVQSVAVGKPIAPIQNSSSGQWYVYEVTSQTVQPLAASTTVIKQELVRGTTNVNRVSKEIVAFARTADVAINPQYGTWKKLTIIPPVAPPSNFLLSANGGISTPKASSVLPTGSGSSSGIGSGSSSAG